MEIKLWSKPKNCILIEGFPGFGLVGTIATEFLIDHLKTELIGKITMEETPAIVAIHENKVVEPLGIFYNKKYNIVVLHAITASAGLEWKLANALLEVGKLLNVREIVSLEGVGGAEIVEEPRTFYFSNNASAIKKFRELGIGPLSEGMIVGVTGALLLKAENFPITCIFADTHTNLPDSKAAAKMIEVLDKYLGLDVDYKPLLSQAEKFESKLQGLLEKSKEASEISEKKKLSYVG